MLGSLNFNTSKLTKNISNHLTHSVIQVSNNFNITFKFQTFSNIKVIFQMILKLSLKFQ